MEHRLQDCMVTFCMYNYIDLMKFSVNINKHIRIIADVEQNRLNIYKVFTNKWGERGL